MKMKITLTLTLTLNSFIRFSLWPFFCVHSVISEMTTETSCEKLELFQMTPVSRAIARHMCVDLSPEGLAARNRRGISIIVYGAPLTGEMKYLTFI